MRVSKVPTSAGPVTTRAKICRDREPAGASGSGWADGPAGPMAFAAHLQRVEDDNLVEEAEGGGGEGTAPPRVLAEPAQLADMRHGHEREQ